MTESGQTASSATDFTTEINQALNKFSQGLKDGSKFQRKDALEKLTKQLKNSYTTKDPKVMKFTPDSVRQIFKSALNVFNDSIEKCRELTCDLILLILESDKDWDNDMTSSLIMAFFQRLGGSAVKETSEEIRFQMYKIIQRLLELKSDPKQKIFLDIYLQEFVSVLVNGFMDSFPEVKKTTCECTRLLAKNLSGQNFHMQSETLVKPILLNFTHQHSRVRKDMIDCLSDVVQHGNNKSVDTVLPHLAQRLFDGASPVRMAVVKLCGSWLLDLPDRYSFWHKLLPLLLSGFIDETIEIKEMTESLWWDIGIKYQKENEEELKDKLDFLEVNIENYPIEFKDKRPNVGCRELIRLNTSKIVPGILNDISDWVEATRIKSVQLLHIMIWQCESNITMHLETVLQTLFKASHENIKEIQVEINKCARLVGHFTDPNLSVKFALKTVQKMDSPNVGAMVILNGIIAGGGAKTPFPLVLDYLRLLNDTSLTVNSQLQTKLIECCENLLPMSKFTAESSKDLEEEFEFLIFKSVFTISALASDPVTVLQVNKLAQTLKELNLVNNTHMDTLIKELSKNSPDWNDNSLEPIIFAKLIGECSLTEQILNVAISILKTCLNPSKDTQLRSKFLLLIPEIFFCLKTPSYSALDELSKTNSKFLEASIEVIINEMIVPNVIWKAGRSAGAVRMSAIAALVMIIQSEVMQHVKIKLSTIEGLLTLLTSVLDDDNKTTRLYVCKIYYIILKYFGQKLSKDDLHKLYPEFIKRLDDANEEVRYEVLSVFFVYMESLKENYDKILYGAHLQMIFENILLYLDDSNTDVQLRVLNLLKESSVLNSELLVEEVEKVKSRHRSTKYCDELIEHCKSLDNKK